MYEERVCVCVCVCVCVREIERKRDETLEDVELVVSNNHHFREPPSYTLSAVGEVCVCV